MDLHVYLFICSSAWNVPPNPDALIVQYGAPTLGLLGAQLTPLILPDPNDPNVSPKIVKAVDDVNVKVTF